MDSFNPSDLEARFLPPENWHWKNISRRDGYVLRYGYVSSDAPDAKTIFILPGLGEFCEKYFELCHDLLKHNHNVVVLDWRGQGLSSRYFEGEPHKRHSHGFENDVHDLKAVIDDCPFAGNGTDYVMLAHSMGGNIGLRFLEMFPNVFKAAAFSAPLIGLQAFEHIPDSFSWVLTHGLNQFSANHYAPMGGEWEPYTRDLNSHVLFSCDARRSAVHNMWMRHNEKLQIGHVTNRWINDAHDSCLYIQKKLDTSVLLLPIIFFLAGHETLVNNGAIRQFSRKLSHSQLIEFPQARHEIWMERDEIRQSFLDNFIHLLGNLA